MTQCHHDRESVLWTRLGLCHTCGSVTVRISAYEYHELDVELEENRLERQFVAGPLAEWPDVLQEVAEHVAALMDERWSGVTRPRP